MNTSDCAAVSTACSPLTARLSMTMSLYGRRPRVVRSFVIWNSLITTLSSETTSLPIENLLFSGGLVAACRKRRSALVIRQDFHRQKDHQDFAKAPAPGLARARTTAILSRPPAALAACTSI